MVRAIDLSLEEEILCETRASPYFSLTPDEVTDILVKKQLGFCIQYLFEGGFTIAGSEEWIGRGDNRGHSPLPHLNNFSHP